MKKSNSITRFLGVIFIIVVAFVMTSTDCIAQEWSRKGKSEFFAVGQYMGGDSTTGLGATFDLDNTIAGGLGFGYNFNDYLNLNIDLFYGSMDTKVKMGVKIDKGNADLFGSDLNLDINILKSRFTPMITGGAGYIRFSGDWEKGLPFDETDFSYNVGGGFRWDVTNNFLIKAFYKAIWTKLEDTDKSVRFDGAVISIGYIF